MEVPSEYCWQTKEVIHPKTVSKTMQEVGQARCDVTLSLSGSCRRQEHILASCIPPTAPEMALLPFQRWGNRGTEMSNLPTGPQAVRIGLENGKATCWVPGNIDKGFPVCVNLPACSLFFPSSPATLATSGPSPLAG